MKIPKTTLFLGGGGLNYTFGIPLLVLGFAYEEPFYIVAGVINVLIGTFFTVSVYKLLND